jgi:plastocyanin
MFRVSGNRKMRRALGLALIAVLAGAALVFSGSDGAGPARAASTTCVWTKHTKRVVKHVKRHGTVTRVVHLKHYRSCRKVAVPEPTPTATAPTPAPATTAPSEPAPTPAPTPEPEANALGVSAYDQGGYRYEPSRQSVRPGQLTLQLNNRGEDPHSMDMQKVGEGAPEGEIIEMGVTKAGAQVTKSVDVEPGTYRMWCTIGNHAEEGMETTITVE